ncbi:MAG: MBL fold metallo-hydrolase [Bacillota bacterium]
MQIHVLASGSSGNSVFIDLGGVRLLVDAGISTRRIEKSLASIGAEAGQIHAVLITHEHSDHIKGLEVLARKYRIPVYARPGVWHAIGHRLNLPAGVQKDLGKGLDIGGVRVEPFKTSHDAADPVGYCFYHSTHKFVVVTDLGVVTSSVADALAYADAVVLESNHDIEMLNNGPYPYFLKQRIRGATGHLSNRDAALALAGIPRKERMHVFLAHLSQENNHPDLAENTVKGILSERGCKVGREIILHRTYRDRISSLVSTPAGCV